MFSFDFKMLSFGLLYVWNIEVFLPLPKEILSAVKFMGFINYLEILVCPKSAFYKCKYSMKKWSTIWICLVSGFTVATSLNKMKLNPTFPYNVLSRILKMLLQTASKIVAITLGITDSSMSKMDSSIYFIWASGRCWALGGSETQLVRAWELDVL